MLEKSVSILSYNKKQFFLPFQQLDQRKQWNVVLHIGISRSTSVECNLLFRTIMSNDRDPLIKPLIACRGGWKQRNFHRNSKYSETKQGFYCNSYLCLNSGLISMMSTTMLSATKYKSLYNSENQKDAKCLMKMNDCIIKKNSFKNNHMYDDIRPRVDAEGRNERQANWVLKFIIAFYARMIS